MPLVRSLLTEERTTVRGRHFRVENASCLPRPVQDRLPIWIGGQGRRRTLRMAARWADGWNAAYVSVGDFADLNGVLEHWCETEQRDPSEIERSVNLTFNLSIDRADVAKEEADLRASFGDMADRIVAGSLLGTPDDAIERILEYHAAGAQQLNIALRAPWNQEALDAYLADVVPAVRAAT